MIHLAKRAWPDWVSSVTDDPVAAAVSVAAWVVALLALGLAQ